MAKTTSDLLTNVKRRTQLPDDGGTLSDSDILAFASDELQNVVFPRLLAMREWHFAFSYTQTLSSARNYRISPRTAGQGIISVEYLDGSNYRFLTYRHPLMQKTSDGENYSIYGNNIVLSDAVSTSGTIRIRAFLRSSQLVSSGCTNIVSIDLNNNRLLVGSSSGFTSSQNVDVIFGNSPYEVFSVDALTSSIPDGTHINMSTTMDSTWPGYSTSTLGRICPGEQTDRVPLPDELHDYLAQRTAIRCMEARGFTGDMQNHLRKLSDLESAFDRLTSPRERGDFKAVLVEDYYLDRGI